MQYIDFREEYREKKRLNESYKCKYNRIWGESKSHMKGTASCKLKDANIYEGMDGSLVIDSE